LRCPTRLAQRGPPLWEARTDVHDVDVRVCGLCGGRLRVLAHNLAYEAASRSCKTASDCAVVPNGCAGDCDGRAVRKSEVAAFERGHEKARPYCDVYWSKSCQGHLPRSVYDCTPPSAFCESGRCIAASRRAYIAGDRLLLREPLVFADSGLAASNDRVLDDIAELAKQMPKKRLSIIVSQEQEPEPLTPEQAKALHKAAVAQASARAAAIVKALVSRGVPPSQVVGKYGVASERVVITLSD